MFVQLLACVTTVVCGATKLPGAAADLLAFTFSIVARDAATGEINVAVQPAVWPERRRR